MSELPNEITAEKANSLSHSNRKVTVEKHALEYLNGMVFPSIKKLCDLGKFKTTVDSPKHEFWTDVERFVVAYLENLGFKVRVCNEHDYLEISW